VSTLLSQAEAGGAGEHRSQSRTRSASLWVGLRVRRPNWPPRRRRFRLLGSTISRGCRTLSGNAVFSWLDCVQVGGPFLARWAEVFVELPPQPAARCDEPAGRDRRAAASFAPPAVAGRLSAQARRAVEERYHHTAPRLRRCGSRGRRRRCGCCAEAEIAEAEIGSSATVAVFPNLSRAQLVRVAAGDHE